MSYKAWEISTTGKFENLQLINKNKQNDYDSLSQNFVIVDVKAIGLNFADVFSILGLYEAAPKANFIPGLEFAGVIKQKSPSITEYEIGDRVMGVTKFGAFSSEIKISTSYLQRIPDQWTFEQGASFIVQGLSAFYSIVELGRAKKDEVVLIHSIAGGVGLFALEIAQKLGMIVMGTLSSQTKKEFVCKEYSIDPDMIIVRQSPEDFEAKAQEALKKRNKTGFDLVLDSLSGDYFNPSFKNTNKGGKYVIFGSGTLMPQGNIGITNMVKLGYNYMKRPTIDPIQIMNDCKSVFGFNLLYYYDKFEYLNEMISRLVEMNLRVPTICKTFEFAQLVEAIKYLQTGQNIGKVVVTL